MKKQMKSFKAKNFGGVIYFTDTTAVAEATAGTFAEIKVSNKSVNL